MQRWIRGRHGLATATILLVVALVVVPDRRAVALITGAAGNTPVNDPGWPKGAAALFNSPKRIAWWEGPPFGGGQWHAEFRGDAQALNAFLADFAKLDVPRKRVIVHDGVAYSVWLNPNREPAKQADARMDWSFAVWQPGSWERLRKLPVDLNPTDPRDLAKGPPAEMDVYTGGNVRWSDVIVPEGFDVDDQRLEAHGFTSADGTVLEGKVVDLATKRPIAARMRLQRVEPNPKGGYNYPAAAESVADAQGHWVLKKAPAGWHRIVIEADGYVARVAGFGQFDDQPHWQLYETGLARPAPVSGRVLDDAGQPLADVEVRLGDVAADEGGRYQTPGEPESHTDADGRFHVDQIPKGHATVWLHKSGYCRPGLGPKIATPAADLEYTMQKSALVRVTVDFTGTERPQQYIVEITPEGGNAVGTWGGSGIVDAQNQITFKDAPPGRYVLSGHPNPTTPEQKSKPVTIDLKGGQTSEITLSGK